MSAVALGIANVAIFFGVTFLVADHQIETAPAALEHITMVQLVAGLSLPAVLPVRYVVRRPRPCESQESLCRNLQ